MIYRPTVHIGSRCPDVKVVQSLLNRLVTPKPNLREDGDFGPKTKAAVMIFQTSERLMPDGVVGPHTWSLLYARAERSVSPVIHRPPPPSPPTQLPTATAPVVTTSTAPTVSHPATQPAGTSLPTRGAARKLALGDFEDAARALGCEVAAVRAVSEVESAGRSGFDAQGRPKILFEAHVFRRQTGGAYDATHPHLSQPTWALAKKYYKLDQWERMHEAMALNKEAAWKSASWGMFQVMGYNHSIAGWHAVHDFVLAMFESEANHLKAFLGFCRSTHLVKHLQAKDWARFAYGYNGAGYQENHYDKKLAAAYKKWSEGAPAAAAVKPKGATKASGGDAIKQACERYWDAHKANCSGFVKAVAESFGITLTGLANDIVGQIQRSPWKVVNASEAVAKAREGHVVVAGLTATGHGHVVIVVDGPMAQGRYPTAYWGTLGREGKKNTTLNYSWGKEDRDKVIYAYHP